MATKFGYFLIASLFWVTEYLPIIYFPLSAFLLVWFAIAFHRALRNAARMSGGKWAA